MINESHSSAFSIVFYLFPKGRRSVILLNGPAVESDSVYAIMMNGFRESLNFTTFPYLWFFIPHVFNTLGTSSLPVSNQNYFGFGVLGTYQHSYNKTSITENIGILSLQGDLFQISFTIDKNKESILTRDAIHIRVISRIVA